MHRPPAPANTRNEDMKRMYLDGMTLAEIGQKHNLTRERVRQILSKQYGIRREDGGESKRARRNEAERIAKREAHSLRKWGCSYVDYWKLVKHPDKPTLTFSSDQKNWNRIAGPLGPKNGVKLWDWWCIWQESGHWGDRGRGHGFRMCRKNSSKGFTLDNVHIVRGGEAFVEAMQRYRDDRRAVSVPPATRYWFSPVA